jgi:hypothetical protein
VIGLPARPHDLARDQPAATDQSSRRRVQPRPGRRCASHPGSSIEPRRRTNPRS